jgi:hypothetical protein
MPILPKIDREKREIHAVAVGPIAYQDVEEHLRQEQQWGGLEYRELIDARGAGLAFSPEDLRKIVELLRIMGHDTKLGPTAVVVSTDYAFGLIEALEKLAAGVCEIRAFRDETDARAWLASHSI